MGSTVARNVILAVFIVSSSTYCKYKAKVMNLNESCHGDDSVVSHCWCWHKRRGFAVQTSQLCTLCREWGQIQTHVQTHIEASLFWEQYVIHSTDAKVPCNTTDKWGSESQRLHDCQYCFGFCMPTLSVIDTVQSQVPFTHTNKVNQSLCPLWNQMFS